MLIITHEDDNIINLNAEKTSLFDSFALTAFAEKDWNLVRRDVAIEGHAISGVLRADRVDAAVRLVDEGARRFIHADVAQGCGGIVVIDFPDAET